VRRGKCNRGKEVRTNLQVVQERELFLLEGDEGDEGEGDTEEEQKEESDWPFASGYVVLYVSHAFLLCYMCCGMICNSCLGTPLCLDALIGVAAVARKSPTLPQGPSLVTLIPPVHPIPSHLSCII
jgi:hypothetical protein